MPVTTQRWPTDGAPLALWGGIEATVNRVGDQYLDQTVRTGHHGRLADLDLIADLGIRTLRYPILWERIVPDDPDCPDWRWTDERLHALRKLGIRPIAGLCHHGSGPRWTGLLDPEFPDHLARFARLVAQRYPWLDAYTPVNEPLTTARFAALYGHWHPHAQDERAMVRAVIHQARATQLAMQAIREINPEAKLIQTEDLARVWSTPPLRYQADYENERRWLSLDMIAGRVDREHPLWRHLRWLGLTETELSPLGEDPCLPDIVGGNYYLTSERFLDHRLDRYPAWTHGGNGRDVYADVEAIRVIEDDLAGPESLLREAWQRYGRPLAITEAHLGSTAEEQVRWLAAIWRRIGRLRNEGIDVRAVTVWALFGSFDWPALCTREDGVYESGAFDVRQSPPQPTRLAELTRSIATNGTLPSPGTLRPGWWERRERLLYPPVDLEGRDVITRAA